jgi:hypothetical protein
MTLYIPHVLDIKCSDNYWQIFKSRLLRMTVRMFPSQCTLQEETLFIASIHTGHTSSDNSVTFSCAHQLHSFDVYFVPVTCTFHQKYPSQFIYLFIFSQRHFRSMPRFINVSLLYLHLNNTLCTS